MPTPPWYPLQQLIADLGLLQGLPMSIALLSGLYVGFGLLELAFPAEPGQTMTGRARNLLLALIAGVLGAVLVALVLPRLRPETHQAPDRGWLYSIALIVLSALLTDLIFYWYHRLQHRLRPLWAIHELHHADNELNVTTALRAYWLDRPLQAIVVGLPVAALISVDERAGLILSVLLPTWLFFAHANLKLRLGALTAVVCGPQVHRIHHSRLPEHQGKNFAQFFPVIDMLFGTYHAPAATEFPPTGAPELAANAPLAMVMLRPLRIWTEGLMALVRSPAADRR